MGTQELMKWVVPATMEIPESSPGTHWLGAGRRCTSASQVRSAHDTGPVLCSYARFGERCAGLFLERLTGLPTSAR